MSYEGYNEFPKALYHATEGTATVKDRAEQDTYGEGWQETPVYPTDPGAEVATPEPVAVKAKRGRPAKSEKTDETAADSE